MRVHRAAAVRACIACLAAIAALSGCERPAQHPALREARLPPLIPTYEFVFNRHAIGGFHFSPDGTRLAWLGPSGWRRALHVRAEATGKTHVYRVGGSSMHWSADGRRLLILDDKSGAENHHLFRLDVEDAHAVPIDLTPHAGVRTWLHLIPKNDPEHVLVLQNRRDRMVRDLYRINLSTGAEELIAQNPGNAVAPITDAEGKFLGWRKPVVADRPRGKPRAPELKERSAIAERRDERTRIVGVSPDRSQAWVLTNRNRDRVALFSVDMKTGVGQLVHEDERSDVEGVLVSSVLGKVVLAASVPDYPRMVILDPQWEADLQLVLKRYDGERYGFDVVSVDPAEQRLVVMVYTHATHRYYLLDRERKHHTLLGESRSAGFAKAVVQPEPVEIEARDGLKVPGYLLRPRDLGEKPLPLVLLVHGGPWGRVVWTDLDRSEDLLRAQFLANRGYAVLVVNFRGSTGYGQAFMLAAVGEFGGKMQDDLLDAAQWAIARGIADPQRLAIMGHSYGGYATLMALAQQPRHFACGVDISGPADLASLIESFPPYWELELSHWYGFVGDPAVPSDRERMDMVSPVHLAGRFERPVLIIQGEKDVRVPPAQQSAAMAHALRNAGKQVEYVSFADMGHSLGYWAHHLGALRKTERFLADCLGGRATRFDPLEWIARLSGRLPMRY